MKIFPTKKDRVPPTPTWMKGGMVIFVVAMAISGYRGEQRASEGDPNAVTIKKYDVLRKFGDIDQWRRVANPSYARDIRYEDLKEGIGDFAACGQQVTVHVVAYPDQDKRVTPELMPQKPVKFTIGDKSVPEAWDRGVRGMREAGERRVWAGARLVFPEITDPDADPVVFDFQLQSMTPNLASGDKPLVHKITGPGAGHPVSCGEEIWVRARVIAADKSVKYESPEDAPLHFVLGDGTYGQGFDRGLVGMNEGEVRQLMIPAPYLPKGNVIPFLGDENAVVEVQRLAYNEKKSSKEPEHEPEKLLHRTPSERDSTLPHHGGERQSRGDESRG